MFGLRRFDSMSSRLRLTSVLSKRWRPEPKSFGSIVICISSIRFSWRKSEFTKVPPQIKTLSCPRFSRSFKINLMSPCLCSRSPGWSILCSLVRTTVRRPGRGEPIAS